MSSDAYDFEDTLRQEIDDALGDMSLMDMMDAEEATQRTAEGAGLRRGRVLAIQGDDIFVDLGGKDQGLLPATQFEDEPLPNVGDLVEFTVVRFDEKDGLLQLSRKGAVMAATWDSLQVGQVLEGRVKGHNKGGLEMDFNGIKGFIPISQVDRLRVEELAPYVNRKLACEVIEIRRAERSIVVSRRAVLDREAAAEAEKRFASLVEGDVIRGTVKTIMPYGAFVDIGGTDGLLHVADMSHRRVENPRDIVTEGQQLEVKVLKVDHEQKRISLGLKQVMPDPWAGADTKWPVNEVVTGRITRLAEFGAFLELTPGVEGLIPISEMTFEKRIKSPSEIVKEGDVVKVRVMSMDLAKKRISLSLKRVGDDPWMGASVRWAEGTITTGMVSRLADFGAFVELTPGVEGLVHVSEISTERVRSVSDALQVGQTVKVKVLQADEAARRISLSIKQSAEVVDFSAYMSTSDHAPEPAPAPAEGAKGKQKKQKPRKGGLD